MSVALPSLPPEEYVALQHTSYRTPEELFILQVDILRCKGLDLPNTDIERLYSCIPRQRQLFLIVPPLPDTLYLTRLMSLIEISGKKGVSWLYGSELSDVVNAPKAAHLLLDVEDGRKRLHTESSVSFQNIVQEGRVAYTTWRGIVHAMVFPYVLKHHYLELVGSRHRNREEIGLYLHNGVPILGRRSTKARHTWGAPSAGGVAGA